MGVIFLVTLQPHGPSCRSVWWGLSSSCLSLTSWSLRGTQGPGPLLCPPRAILSCPGAHTSQGTRIPTSRMLKEICRRRPRWWAFSASVLSPLPSFQILLTLLVMEAPGLETNANPTAGRQALWVPRLLGFTTLGSWCSGPQVTPERV